MTSYPHASDISFILLVFPVLNVDMLRLKDLVFDWESVAMAALVSIPMVSNSYPNTCHHS